MDARDKRGHDESALDAAGDLCINPHWGEQIGFRPGRILSIAMTFQGLEKYDPDGLFFVHHGVGSERWSADGFTPVR